MLRTTFLPFKLYLFPNYFSTTSLKEKLTRARPASCPALDTTQEISVLLWTLRIENNKRETITYVLIQSKGIQPHRCPLIFFFKVLRKLSMQNNHAHMSKSNNDENSASAKTHNNSFIADFHLDIWRLNIIFAFCMLSL